MRTYSRTVGCCLLSLVAKYCTGFSNLQLHSVNKPASTCMFNERFNRNIDERSRERAQGQGGGEMAAGAILGGLIGGPFGVLFGAQIGANLGSKNAVNRAREEEMERLGITQDMLDSAQECGVALDQSMEALQASQSSLETQQSLARRLDRESEELYEKAKGAMTNGDEEIARSFLLQRTQTQEKLKGVLKLCVEEKNRLAAMKDNVAAIEKRALEVEALLQRTVSSKTRMNTAITADVSDFSVPVEDPLLKKFRDMGID